MRKEAAELGRAVEKMAAVQVAVAVADRLVELHAHPHARTQAGDRAHVLDDAPMLLLTANATQPLPIRFWSRRWRRHRRHRPIAGVFGLALLLLQGRRALSVDEGGAWPLHGLSRTFREADGLQIFLQLRHLSCERRLLHLTTLSYIGTVHFAHLASAADMYSPGVLEAADMNSPGVLVEWPKKWQAALLSSQVKSSQAGSSQGLASSKNLAAGGVQGDPSERRCGRHSQ